MLQIGVQVKACAPTPAAAPPGSRSQLLLAHLPYKMAAETATAGSPLKLSTGPSESSP